MASAESLSRSVRYRPEWPSVHAGLSTNLAGDGLPNCMGQRWAATYTFVVGSNVRFNRPDHCLTVGYCRAARTGDLRGVFGCYRVFNCG
jgi:hypothetical protein